MVIYSKNQIIIEKIYKDSKYSIVMKIKIIIFVLLIVALSGLVLAGSSAHFKKYNKYGFSHFDIDFAKKNDVLVFDLNDKKSFDKHSIIYKKKYAAGFSACKNMFLEKDNKFDEFHKRFNKDKRINWKKD